MFIRNGYIRQLTDHVPLKVGSKKLLTPGWAVAKANSLATVSKEKLQRSGVEVYGDLDSLDSAIVPEGEPEYPLTIDISTVAKAMLGFDKTLAKRVPFRWLVRWTTGEVKRRLKWTIKSIFVRS